MVGPQVVWAVLRQVARDRHTERDRVAYEMNSVRTQLEGPKEYIPIGVELSAWPVLGTQGEQGTQLAGGLLGFVNTRAGGTHN